MFYTYTTQYSVYVNFKINRAAGLKLLWFFSTSRSSQVVLYLARVVHFRVNIHSKDRHPWWLLKSYKSTRYKESCISIGEHIVTYYGVLLHVFEVAVQLDSHSCESVFSLLRQHLKLSKFLWRQLGMAVYDCGNCGDTQWCLWHYPRLLFSGTAAASPEPTALG
jgi:hypothetical protein